MMLFRWILGTILVLLGGGYTILLIVAAGFRSSFGASDNNPLVEIFPLVAAVVLLAGLIFPTRKKLLHSGAIGAVGLVAFCIYMFLTEAAVVLWYLVLYLAAWLFFYWRSAFQQ